MKSGAQALGQLGHEAVGTSVLKNEPVFVIKEKQGYLCVFEESIPKTRHTPDCGHGPGIAKGVPEIGQNNIQDSSILLIKVRPIAGPPNAQIPNIQIPVIGIKIYAMVQTVSHQKIIEKLGLFKFFLGHDFTNKGRPLSFLKEMCDGVMKLKVDLIPGNISGAHVE